MFQFLHVTTVRLVSSQYLLFKTLVKSQYIAILFGVMVPSVLRSIQYFPTFHNGFNYFAFPV